MSFFLLCFYCLQQMKSQVKENSLSQMLKGGSTQEMRCRDSKSSASSPAPPQVRDQEIPMKRNFAKVVIHVEDCNDHSPAFLSPRYEASISNQAPTGSEVIRVKALDKDTGSNADISYSLHSGEQRPIFTFHRRSRRFHLRSASHSPAYAQTHLGGDSPPPPASFKGQTPQKQRAGGLRDEV